MKILFCIAWIVVFAITGAALDEMDLDNFVYAVFGCVAIIIFNCGMNIIGRFQE